MRRGKRYLLVPSSGEGDLRGGAGRTLWTMVSSRFVRNGARRQSPCLDCCEASLASVYWVRWYKLLMILNG